MLKKNLRATTFLRYALPQSSPLRDIVFPKDFTFDGRYFSIWLDRNGYLFGLSTHDDPGQPVAALTGQAGRVRRIRQIKRPGLSCDDVNLIEGYGYTLDFERGVRMRLRVTEETPFGMRVEYEFPWTP